MRCLCRNHAAFARSVYGQSAKALAILIRMIFALNLKPLHLSMDEVLDTPAEYFRSHFPPQINVA